MKKYGLILLCFLCMGLWCVINLLNIPSDHLGEVWVHLKFPRFFAAIITGASLGLAGYLLQTITHNPLSSPSVLGITSGGQLGLLLSLLLPAALRPLNLIAVFLGCLLGAVITFLLAGKRGKSSLRLILAGTGTNIFLAAICSLLLILNETHIAGLAIWQAGSLYQANLQPVLYSFLPFLICLGLAYYFRQSIALLTLGDSVAYILGCNTQKTHRISFFIAICLTSCAVVLAGPIAFVGLLSPHIAKYLGYKHPIKKMRGSIWAGILIMFIADAIIQAVTATYLPLGLVTALVGAPFLIALVLKSKEHDKPQKQFAHRGQNSILIWLSIGLLIPLFMYIGLYKELSVDIENRLLMDVRMPRVLSSLCVGSLLAASGWLMQRLFRNALAVPEMLGITQGAALGNLLLLLFFSISLTDQLLASLIGSLTVIGLLIYLNRQARQSFRLIICGLAISGTLVALTTLIIIAFKVQATQAVIWLNGSLYGQTMTNSNVLIFSLLLLIPVFKLLPSIHLLNLGDSVAFALGVSIFRLRNTILLLVAVMTAVSVAMVGPIAFVGLIATHIARHFTNKTSQEFILSLFVGATLCLLSDVVGRYLFSPIDIPLGLMTTLLGAPYLLYTLSRKASLTPR
ncbi:MULTISPECIES: iron ABC transporter permease [Oligella]|uniref:iron ABC transporter permease n=1 Tax=Oligella TaxID=90243 RepID=UPI0009F6D23B|nr:MULTISPECIES: iron ABC transporter permease [Oligella]AVL70311.1 iron ABC transporter permease [Oligella urethralis]PMC15366.1 iron ABC transporter permease [Oligella urethralis]